MEWVNEVDWMTITVVIMVGVAGYNFIERIVSKSKKIVEPETSKLARKVQCDLAELAAKHESHVNSVNDMNLNIVKQMGEISVTLKGVEVAVKYIEKIHRNGNK